MTSNFRVVLVGTDPASQLGGISVALDGFAAALRDQGVLEEVVPSHLPGGAVRKLRLAWEALRDVRRLTRRIRRRGETPVVYAHAGPGTSLVRKAILLRAARRLGAITVLQLHTIRVDEYVDSLWGRWLLRRVCRHADVVCVLTPWWRNRLAGLRLCQPVAIVPDPLPTATAERAARSGHKKHRSLEAAAPSDEDGVRVLIVTRLVVGKGVGALIRAMKRLPSSFTLTVAGDGPERHACEELVRTLGLEGRITFTGWVTGQRKTALFEDSDVFCLPTLMDSFGMGFVEAMAHELPVVGVRCGPTSGVIADGVTGLLAASQDADAVATALASLADPALRLRMGEAGRRFVYENLSPERVGRTLLDVLELARSSSGAPRSASRSPS